MREITTSNFDLKFNEIEKVLQQAQFVSLDTEITGITVDKKSTRCRFGEFDSAEDLYLKMKHNVKDFIIIQLGLTAFHFNPSTKKYTASCYVFYVYPRSVSTLQKTFLVQPSVFETLSKTDFDFNKVFYKGITCLNNNEEKQIFNDLVKHSMVDGCIERPISLEEERELQSQLSTISKWQVAAKDGATIELEDIDTSKKLFVYLLHKEIHRRFGNCWTFKTLGGGILIQKVTDVERPKLVSQAENNKIYEKELLEHYVGVSRVFKLLSIKKCPIIGSNPLLDLMIMYQQFHDPLPNSYKEFKTELNNLLPHIYDAKYIGIKVEDMCAKHNIAMDDTNGLTILSKYFESGKGSALPTFMPPIELTKTTNSAPNTITQEAGWDSYYTGCCFIRMAHFLAKENFYGCVEEMPPEMTLVKLFAAGIKQHKNCVVTAQANIPYLRLDKDDDPKPDKTQQLIVTTRSSFATKSEWIFEDLSPAALDSMHVTMLSNKCALVAVNSSDTADRVIKRCMKYQDYDVEYYKGSNKTRALLTGGAIIVTGLCLWKVYNYIR